jgi:hypothetical protein
MDHWDTFTLFYLPRQCKRFVVCVRACVHPGQTEFECEWQQYCISCWQYGSEAPYRMSNKQHPARPYRPLHRVHHTACARATPDPAALRLSPPLRQSRRPRPAATPLCAGRPQSYKSAHCDTPSHARLLVSSASKPRLPPSLAAPAPEITFLAARRRQIPQ